MHQRAKEVHSLLSIAKCRDLDYYEREVIDGREDYLSESGTSPGQWVGSLAAADGYAGIAQRDHLARAFSGVHPAGFKMTAHDLTVPGFDMTLSPSKSVSLLWALGSDDDARSVEASLYAARREVERFLEADGCFVRRGHAGASVEHGNGFFGAVFLHRTSRLGDPGIHLHWTVFNVTEGPDGRRTALDARHLYRLRYTAEAVFQATLRRELVERRGVVFDEIDRHGVAEIVGISSDMRKAFSGRRAEIVAEMDRRGVHSGDGARVAALATRKAKPVGITEAELRESWRQKALDHSFDLSQVPRIARATALSVTDDALAASVTLEHATFDRSDAIRACANAGRQGASLDEILARAGAFLAAPLAIEVGEDRWTTQEILDLERSVVDVAAAPRRSALMAEPVSVRAALEARPSMSDEQRRMVEELTASGRSLDVVIGRAGTGKTFSLDAVREAYEESGHRVFGTALAARAARQLQLGAGIRSTTAHALLNQLDTGRVRFRKGDVLVVDEVGMMGTRTLAALVGQAHREGAKTILVGDHKQLPEIEAGGLLAALAERVPVIELTQNRRQQDPAERFIVQALRKGLAELAVRRLDSIGHVTVAHNADALRDQLVLDWWQHRSDNREVLMGAAHRSDVRDLNARAHALLEASGAVGPVVAEVDDLRLCQGDQVMALKNRYDIGILNGDVGEIVGAVGQVVDVRIESGEIRHLPLDYVTDHLAHAYARTIHKNQGLTCEVGLVLADDTLFAEAGYTMLTRATDETHLYAVVGAHDLDQDGYPLAHIVQSLSTSRAKTAAIDYMEELQR